MVIYEQPRLKPQDMVWVEPGRKGKELDQIAQCAF